MKKRRILFVFIFLAVSTLKAQTNGKHAFAPAHEYSGSIEKATQIIHEFLDKNNLPGFSVAAGVDGKIVWTEGFGWADVENRVRVTPLTKFRVGSVSKSLTGAAVMLLHENGKLDLDAPVQKYVPDFPEKRWPISTRQVAGHIAGIRHYRGLEFLSSKNFKTVAQGLDVFEDDTLLFQPGTKYSYSSYGWNLVSAVIEGASDEEFLAFMRENVFWPIGMIHTSADHVDSLIAYRTRFYARSGDGAVINAPFVDNSYKWAGGGFIANTADMVRFGMAFFQPGFLKQTSIDILWQSLKTDDGKPTNYGIGWRTNKDAEGRHWVGHSGGSVGGTAFLIVYPEQKVVVSILTNIGGARWGDLPQQLAAAFIR